MAEEAMESYLYAAYHPYSYRYPPPKGKGGAAGGWRPRGSGYFSGYGEAAAAAEYFDNYQRAQLKAILSQVNPNLTPRLRKANTKEVGVQVNPRQDASVQCSLGPRTLLRRRPGPPAGPRPREAEQEREQEQGSPATTSTRAVRFPRTIAVYSPMASRRLTAFLEEPSPEPERRPQQEEAAAPAVEEEPAALREQREAEAAAVRASWEKPPEGGAEPLGSPAEPWAAPEPLGQRPAATPEPPAAGPEESQDEAAAAARAEPPAAPQKREPAAGKTRLRFQFLEQKYGYYHCKDCNIRWESAYVWCVQGTNKVYFRQFCRTCQKSYNPYRVEDITCQSCKQTRCTCPVKMRHVDPKRPHRQDLCGRCKGKRLSCDSTFSFKYII
ncbi:LOW QUALITY PROTEIN: zygote arrest protein 1 [Gymnogyps californianus]|uniref:LOW QUALITY PROTEIN: zygote arrest protein 1 n=1 Tax=Gymnogyps californianus TaxID=33616 RepID=UPI0021C64466|nr:LOW QUALITY PROTEIN: zygote arrest protein 1 [Gymnogyps californianus]